MLKEVRKCLYTKDKSKLNIFLNVVIVFVVLVFAVEIAFTLNYSGVYIVHSSMYPTLTGADSDDVIGGDYVYVNKHAKPDYGDIVVVYDGKGEYLIKRAIAFGGDTVRLDKGQLYIKYKGQTDFTCVEEEYLDPDCNDPNTKKNNFHSDDGYVVKGGHFFLLGDNRNISLDSRDYGDFPLDNLDGVVTKWSLEHKSFCTAVYSYFKFQLPSFFGLK